MPRPARPWFRFYVEAVHDRKLRRLKPEHRWLFVACLAAARQSCEPGQLLVGEHDPMTVDDLVDFAGMSRSQVAAGMTALVQAGVVSIDRTVPRERFVIPAWADRQYESDVSTERVRKHRKERSNGVPETQDVTPPETEAETDTETPPNPPDRIDRIVDGVFAKVLAEKERRGESIASVEGYRKWWDKEQAAGCRKRAQWMLENYDIPTLSQQVAFTHSIENPRWAGSYLKSESGAA